MGTHELDTNSGYYGEQFADDCPSCDHPAEGVETPIWNRVRVMLGMKPAPRRCAEWAGEDGFGACDCRHLWHTVSQN